MQVHELCPQKVIFDNALKFEQTQRPNFGYLEGNEASQLVKTLINPECFNGNHMQQVKTLVATLQAKITAQINAEIVKAKDTVCAFQERLCGMSEFATLTPEQQKQITRPFSEFSVSVESQKLIAMIRETLRSFEESNYQRLLSQLTSWTRPAQVQALSDHQNMNQDLETTNVKPDSCIVAGRSLQISFDKVWLADEIDVDRYLKSMRKALLAEIGKGKRIQV